MSTAPVVPPRPARADKETPKIPPRPINKRLDRSTSPNRDRFAPSPINGGIPPKDTKPACRVGQQNWVDTLDGSGGVSMPSVGEEGAEYGALSQELKHDAEQRLTSSPKQTRTVSQDLKLHAPKPSLPASSAKKQVMTVTRTDSERAASFGIGRATSHHGDERDVSRNSVKKRPSSTFSAHSDHQTDDEHGIPEIGQRVPMNPHLGDVQAPSPSPGPGSHSDGSKKQHNRKLSARGLPPGSYGLHGHGVSSQDRLDKAYYQKHPEALEKEQHTSMHERNNDFAMSRNDLNRLVRDTSRQGGLGTRDFVATPTEEVAFHASEEYTSRISSVASPRKDAPRHEASGEADETIHVEDKHPEYCHYGAEDDTAADAEEDYNAPILAADEVDAASQVKHPAVRPHPERRTSHDRDESPVRQSSRPPVARASHSQADFGSTPLEDVEEYEPLFTEEAKEEIPKHEPADENESRHHFPSKDVWEDAPSSVHYTATVSTPDVSDQHRRRSSAYSDHRPITPAQAFAQYQEQLAEKETASGKNMFLPLSEEKPTWINHQPHLKAERASPSKRFPSRDVWEDVPESQLHETTVFASPVEEKKPEIPLRPDKRQGEQPAVAERLRNRQGSGEKEKPPVSDKPKPQIPARPVKSLSGDGKSKPAVPSRPVGSKIASLQAGFMSDLNKRLQLGPQAPKKEVEEEEKEKEKAPLADARKGRARGPQRRAPARTGVAVAGVGGGRFAMTMPLTTWSIDPDEGRVEVGGMGGVKTQGVDEGATSSDRAGDAERVSLKKNAQEEEASLDQGGEERTSLDNTEAKGETLKKILEGEQADGQAETSLDKREEEEVSLKKSVDKADEAEGESVDKTDEAEAESVDKVASPDSPVIAAAGSVGGVQKTLASNMAGESVLEASIVEGESGVEVAEVRGEVQ